MVKTIIEKTSPKSLLTAVRIIRKGGLVIYPTETCYGLGGDATNPKAVKKVYMVKKRPTSKPIHIIVSSLKMIQKYGMVTDEIKFLIKKFMPGPLSIVTRKKSTIPGILNPKEITFRIPSNPVAYKLVKKAGIPITTTSANISGQPPLYKIKDIVKTFDGKVDMILDYGNMKKIKPSTFIDMKGKPRLLRKGPISGVNVLRELEKFRSRQSVKRAHFH